MRENGLIRCLIYGLIAKEISHTQHTEINDICHFILIPTNLNEGGQGIILFNHFGASLFQLVHGALVNLHLGNKRGVFLKFFLKKKVMKNLLKVP